MSTLILAGVALGALLGAIVAYLTITSGQMMRSALLKDWNGWQLSFTLNFSLNLSVSTLSSWVNS
jgi:ABC-type Fe3+-siderophore transport system permease subunit